MPLEEKQLPDQYTSLPNGGLVSFLIAGAQKSGTTALANYLRMHPKIYIPEGKEVHYFDRDKNFVADHRDYSRYHSAFRHMRTSQVGGEATPRYMYWPTCAERIRNYNPNMRLMFVLRNPIERAYSHWQMQRKRGRESLDFGQAIRTETERLENHHNSRDRGWYAYLERGNYSDQIRRYMDLFPRPNLLFLKSEQLQSEHSNVLTRICEFLRLPVFDPAPEPHVSFALDYEPMDVSDRKFLENHFQPGIKKLERLLDWNCSSWFS